MDTHRGLTTYDVTYGTDGGTEDQDSIEAASDDEALAEALRGCEAWIRDGDWGAEGARIPARVWLRRDTDRPAECAWCYEPGVGLDADGDPACAAHAVAAGPVRAGWIEIKDSTDVDIAPDHDALIRAAGGDPDCDHEWTSEGEGGCTENPGVWSLGGTTMAFAEHCTRCGLRRHEVRYGRQRNPGEADTVRYEMPEED